MKYRQMVTRVHIFPNKMVMVFDQNGGQMPRFQGGRTPELMGRIRRRVARQKTKVLGMN